ncbi:hypothetical protein F5Y19DRAFT_30540 [Xylariaceae sp. FL1651]|nr:hypothetical protein F5Y19DRAFT_30540 [Xylariaceae sp. FL1651]
MGLDLANTPAATPPDGVSSNLVNPESRSWDVELTIGVTLLPAVILVVLRVYARLGLVRKLGVDDFLDKPGGGPFGPHLWDVSVLQLIRGQWPTILGSAVAPMSNTLVKVSLLAFYLRIFNAVPRLKILIWVGLVSVIGFGVVLVIATLTACIPRNGDLDDVNALSPSSGCIAFVRKLTTAGTVFGVISDFYILFIPLHILPSMKLSRKRKAAVSSVFLLGSFACLAALTNFILRFAVFLPQQETDWTWHTINAYIARVAEMNISLICCCMPAVSPLVLGPMQRFGALVSSWFRKPQPEAQGTKGYRDQSAGGTSTQSTQTPPIPRGTLTGLRTRIWNIFSSKAVVEDSTNLNTLPMYSDSSTVHDNYDVSTGVSQPSSTHGSHTDQSDKDASSVERLAPL